MNSLQPAPTLETCPNCAQKTASEFFKVVKKRRICALCAARATKADAAAQADLKDHHLHGGLGWLWKHIAYVAWFSVGATVVRYLIRSYFHAH